MNSIALGKTKNVYNSDAIGLKEKQLCFQKTSRLYFGNIFLFFLTVKRRFMHFERKKKKKKFPTYLP